MTGPEKLIDERRKVVVVVVMKGEPLTVSSGKTRLVILIFVNGLLTVCPLPLP